MIDSGFPDPSSTLAVRFVVYLPAEPENPVVDARQLETAIVRLLCEVFGGVTAYEARGTFALASGEPTTEPVTVLEIYCERETWRENKEGVGQLVRLIGHLLQQEAVGCSIDGRMIVIPSSAPSSPPGQSTGDLYLLLRHVMDG